MRITRWKVFAAAAAAATTAIGVAAAPADAQAPPTQLHVIRTLATNYVAPLQFAVFGRAVFVADAATATIDLIGRDKPLAKGLEGGDVGAVAVDPRGLTLGYSTSNEDHSDTRFTILSPFRSPVVANLSGFEASHNPDGAVKYGVKGKVSQCVKDSLAAGGLPVNNTGEVDSHPYAATALGHGAWAVADAGGNDIVRVDRFGHVSLISVLPRQALHVTAQFAEENGLPECTVGVTYYFEPVPTDVEVGPGGWLYVTTLPGGVGVAGSVYRVNPWNGHATQIATGFAGATNLAVTSGGTIYVAELFGGTISRIVHGQPYVVAHLPAVAAVEWANGHLYASTAPAALLEDDGPSGPGGGPSSPPPPGTVVVLGH